MNDPYGLDASELPPELIAQLTGARNQRAIAEAMLRQSMQPIEVQQPKGRFQGVVSPLEAIAKLAQGAGARGDMAASDRVAEAVARQQTQGRADAMAQYQRTKMGVPGTQPLTPNDDEGNPMPSVGGVKGDPRAAIANALAGQYMRNSPFLKWEQQALDKSDNREDQQAFLSAQQRQRAADAAALAKQNAMDRSAAKAEADQRALEGRKEMAGIAASLRQPPNAPAVTPTDIVDEATGRVYKVDARTGQRIGLSPADTKIQGALNQDTATLQSSTAELDRLASTANELRNHKGLEGITGPMGKVPNFPGSDSANAEAKLATLKSQVGFGVLQAMRNASKTGGALGNVSDAEGKRLEANLAALDKAQSYEEFKTQLDKIVQFTDDAKGRLREAYNLKHGDRQPSGGASPAKGRIRYDANGNEVP